ncbi:tautomerase family protein [Luteibacter aegosomatissinici]|uniref:tautomerase family protein n=1 Tax=Luteibacter aegosomatissinici TaxID=2911539 RepID=UPI001FF781E2|nr:4-oxalocrotonate tautomerase family protein [Luteibacter aegosomatissinici]UPG94550.1 4-oxalocrotonate tautomerase family protein [Luteibacter aegosomatissinici]
MPIVTIQVTREGTLPGAERTTREQKEALHKGVCDLLFEVLGKHPDDTFVVFQEIELEDWGRGSSSVIEYRKRKAQLVY